MPYLKGGYIKEVIVVEGNSTDQTPDVIRSFPVSLLVEQGTEAYDHSIIRSHYSKYNAMNQGWRNCHTELVMFLDSDAYLGADFFPEVLGFFKDEKLGILGCWAKAWDANPFGRTLGEMWQFHAKRIAALQSSSPKIFEKLYQYAAWFGNKRILTSGPCYIARRECLEKVGGHDILGDVGLCLHITESGWSSHWWTESTVYHQPAESLKELWRQRKAWGMDGAFRPGGGWRHSLYFAPRVVGSIGLGAFLAIRFRNPLHLLTLPTAELGLLSGYIAGKIIRARGGT